MSFARELGRGGDCGGGWGGWWLLRPGGWVPVVVVVDA